MKHTLIFAISLGLVAAIGCGDEHGHDHEHDHPDAGEQPDASAGFAHTLYVAGNNALVSYDLATGEEKPGTVTDVASPTDLTALDDGRLVVNLTTNNQILFVDGTTMLEIDRIASSLSTGTRPVHGFLTPPRDGEQYWMALNDGDDTLETNSAVFIDVVPSSPTYLEVVAEVPLGLGHHKAAFSSTGARVAISSISACDDVLQVFDYSDIDNVQEVASASAADLGYADCNPDQFAVPAPHGCASSDTAAYCNLTGPGQIAAIDIDASPPTFTVLDAAGTGAGYTATHPDGRYVYSLQATPREGDGGSDCQIGQLVVVDSMDDSIATEVPLLYKGPDCTDPLTGTDEESTRPGHIQIAGDTLFVTPAGGYGVDDARTRYELVLDISDPAAPTQQASIMTGTGTGHVNDALSGDQKWLFVANQIDNTVTQIDATELTVEATLDVVDAPQQVATFGDAEGPSHRAGQ